MANYAIGDIQGCFEPLQALLTTIGFDRNHDQLWLTGDLINRGPDSLKVLHFLTNLPKPAYITLGNHDLHFLAVAYEALPSNPKDTFQDILQSNDKAELCDWLKHQPLFHYDANLNFAMSHAGILPPWSIVQAGRYAKEVEQQLQGPHFIELLANQYGNLPNTWNEGLTGWERYRFIVNAFTRMRFCTEDGALDLSCKTGIDNIPTGLIPWFLSPQRAAKDTKILFGHWAALDGKVKEPNIYALDTGCVWGKCLTAIRLEDQKYFWTKC